MSENRGYVNFYQARFLDVDANRPQEAKSFYDKALSLLPNNASRTCRRFLSKRKNANAVGIASAASLLSLCKREHGQSWHANALAQVKVLTEVILFYDLALQDSRFSASFVERRSRPGRAL